MSKKIIVIVNQKGGVGKTTTSINLSAGLARAGKRVLLIDLDPQAHSTIGLGIKPESFEISISDVLGGKKRGIQEATLPTETPNLFLIPSHIRLDRVEQQLNPELFRETFLKKAVKNLDYDFIVVDCRPTLGTLTINALYASDFILVPCEMGRYALDGFSDLMETIETVKNNTKNKGDYIRILLTKYDMRNKVSNEWVFNQLAPFKDLLLETIIRRSEALNQSQMSEEHIFSFKEDSPGAEDYKKLTEEIIKICQTSEQN